MSKPLPLPRTSTYHNRVKVHYQDQKTLKLVELPDAVFPIQFADLLDERLDEAYITIGRTEVDHFPPTMRFLVDVQQIKVEYDNLGDPKETIAEEKTVFFVVASDEAQQLPLANPTEKTFWKHNLYLIEETKLLEGVICPSMTFTNATDGVYAPDTWVVGA